MSFVKRLVGVVQYSPVVLPATLAAFSVIAAVFLLIGIFNTLLVSVFGVAAAVGAGWLVIKNKLVSKGSKTEQIVVDFVVVFGVLIWCAWNIAFASQHIYTNRDPATYANAAAWLVKNDSLQIETLQIFGQDSQVKVTSPGFESLDAQPQQVYAQGQHLSSALLGFVGRFVGENTMLRLSPVFGAIALLAVYGFARQFIKPRWALVSVAALAFSLPLIHFSRDSFTEPLTMVFIFGSLSVLTMAFFAKNKWLWLLAGVIAGASALVRVDAYVTFVGLAAFLGIYLFVQAKADRGSAVKFALLFLLGLFSVALIGILDIYALSPFYFDHHKHFLVQELLALFAIIFASAILIAINWCTKIFEKLKTSWLGWVLAGLVLLISVGLAARPLLYTDYTKTQDNSIANFQKKEGIPISPRSYDELSVNWLTWYMGVPAVALGAVGLAVASYKTTKRDQFILAAGVLAVVTTALVYLVKPSISPDQIWASRRYLPVVIPGLLVFAAYGLDQAFKHNLKSILNRVLAGAAVLIIMIPPIVTSWPFLIVRDVVQLPSVLGLCEKLPNNAAVLWVGDAQHYLVQPTRSYCQVPVASYKSGEITQQQLLSIAKAAERSGYVPVVALLGGDVKILPDASLSQVGHAKFQEMESRLLGPPQKTETKEYKTYAGVILPDGTIKPLD